MDQALNPQLEQLKAEIRNLHTALVEAHLQKNIPFFVENIADDYFSVNGGEIRHPSKEEIQAKFEYYLGRTSFTEYRDLEEPLIGISRDGSSAWSIVRVKISGTQQQEDGSQSDLDFICAWITLYERQGKKWIRLGEVSSF